MFCSACRFLAILLTVSLSSLAASPQESARAVIDRGLEFLRTQQRDDGSWHREGEPPAITALVLKAFVRQPNFSAETPFVARGYKVLLDQQVEDGGIYKDLLANYNTAIAVSALVAANRPEFAPRIERAVAYLRNLQWTQSVTTAEGEDVEIASEADPWHGGWGYGGRSRGKGRPDLSNVSITLDALHDAGIKPEDPAFQAAIRFVTRLQNSSSTNDQPWAGDDGGFIYGPGDDRRGESMAGESPLGDGRRGLRSYGSMTYAGLKSFIHAGLTRDDPRVRAAFGWISANWTLEENPGMGLGKPENAKQGLYYYYHTLARAMNVFEQPTIETPDGRQIDWRIELINKVASLQQPDGSFVGEKRWMEDNPVLVTSYVVLALQEALEDLEQHPPR
jgi:squalene-hopene/tetraprenyl-beta-curcumene cyclase